MVTVNSCSLDRYPISSISEDVFYTTPSGVESAVIAAYNALLPYEDELWRYTELRSDNTHCKDIMIDNKNIQLLHADFFTYSNLDSEIHDYIWAPAYKVISRCNLVIRNIDNVTDEAQKSKLYSEAIVLRSMMYFDLIRMFKEVYYVDGYLSGQDALKMTPTPSETILENIINDMELAASDKGGLPKPSEQKSSETGRITSYAAKGLLAKMYLTQKNYDKVISTLKPVIDAYGTTDLVAFSEIFKIKNEMNKELLLCARYSGPNKGIGSKFPNYFAADGSEGTTVVGKGQGYNVPADDLCRLFGIKYDWSMSNGVPKFIDGTTVDFSATKDLRAAVSVKFFENAEIFWPSKYWNSYSDYSQEKDCENDFPLLRYSDCLLMYAEAINKGHSNPSEAAAYVNAVRTRAGLDNLTSAETASVEAMHSAILRERRLELAFENQRYFDLLREGNDFFVKTINAQFANDEFYKQVDNSGNSRPKDITADKILLDVPYEMSSLYE